MPGHTVPGRVVTLERPRGPPGRGPAAAVHGADRRPGRPTAVGGRWRSPPRRPRRTSGPRSRPSPSGAGAGAALVAVRGGTPLTRRLICEEARLGHGTAALLIEDVATPTPPPTAVLSGRADLVAALESPHPRERAHEHGGSSGRGAALPGRAASRDLRPLFAPRGIAVIGASRDPAKLGAVMTQLAGGFPGAVAGINPRDADLSAGRYRSVADAVDAHRRAHRPGRALRARRRLGRGAHRGRRGRRARRAGLLRRLRRSRRRRRRPPARPARGGARAAGVALLGPNTSGFLAPARGLTASFVPGAAAVPAGPVAVVAASGGVNHALAFLLAEAGIGVSPRRRTRQRRRRHGGRRAVHLAADEDTRAVALHVESVPNGPALVAAVRRACRPQACRRPRRRPERRRRLRPLAHRRPGHVVAHHPRGARGRRAPSSWTTSGELVDAVTALSALRLPAGRGPRRRRGHRPGRARAAARRRPARRGASPCRRCRRPRCPASASCCRR